MKLRSTTFNNNSPLISILLIPVCSRFGASILVDDQSTSVAFGQLAFNPQCFIVFENPSKPPGQWNSVRIKYSVN